MQLSFLSLVLATIFVMTIIYAPVEANADADPVGGVIDTIEAQIKDKLPELAKLLGIK
ncbi:PREDICTED: uncharacterized protein LOC105458859 [Wasmannia auropunctata]|uniref:uncharacterized protein LOC105458859 n=1 Tax=Wasmannia auropunctata TaxID=64793 RepID=UPI0005EF7095|nr:PREDICTED: uncharacterized protein LOC105458859 [Wasmannia auropunctata]